jgi:HK97 gp10 family phage protein
MAKKSKLVGADGVIQSFIEMPDNLRSELGEALIDAGQLIQRTAVSLVPRDSGNLAEVLNRPEGIKIDLPGLRLEVGFVTAQQKKDGWYGHFVEFGTKGYVAGQKRIAGRTRTGRGVRRASPGSAQYDPNDPRARSLGGSLKFRAVRRDVPARPARPFLRPALDLNMEKLRELHRRALVASVLRGGRVLVKKALGFSARDGD